ncbi:MAG: amidohydrolase [Caldilineaceae bacterium]
MTLINTFKQEADAMADQLVAWRRDFHMHPELGFQEVRTAGIVAEHLHDLGLEVSTGVGRTGVVALVEPDDVAADAPTVLLRFDMDALPIDEQNDVPYRSQNPGVMHACGHDGHTAIGMGVATLLTKHRQELAGRVKLVFQPAEEGLGGAMAMIDDGIMRDPAPSAAFALHLWSRLPLNHVVTQAGPIWASAGKFRLVVRGRGGHGAVPHETIDATVVAAQILVNWQTIVSRNVSPLEAAVVTVGSLRSGEAYNIISAEAELLGTYRVFSEEMRTMVLTRLEEMAQHISAAYGATCTFEHISYVPATVNSPAGAALMTEVATQVVGTDKLLEIDPMMVGEDMSEMLNRAPGALILVGAARADGTLHSPHHNPTFDFDEAMLPTGVAMLAGAAAAYLEQQRA